MEDVKNVYAVATTNEQEFDIKVVSTENMIMMVTECMFSYNYEDALYSARALTEVITRVFRDGKFIMPFKTTDGRDTILSVTAINLAHLPIINEAIYLAMDSTERKN